MKYSLFIVCFFIVILSVSKTYSQSDSLKLVNESNSLNGSDSLSVKQDTTEQITKFTMQKSTWKAIALSAVPGAGQIYVESYWKAPLFFGAAVALGYFIYRNDAQYADYQSKYNYLTCYLKYNESNNDVFIAKRRMNLYRDWRDQTAFYLMGVYVLAAVDAYVGAHLYDFDVSDDLSFSVTPNYQGGFSLNLSYSR